MMCIRPGAARPHKRRRLVAPGRHVLLAVSVQGGEPVTISTQTPTRQAQSAATGHFLAWRPIIGAIQRYERFKHP